MCSGELGEGTALSSRLQETSQESLWCLLENTRAPKGVNSVFTAAANRSITTTAEQIVCSIKIGSNGRSFPGSAPEGLTQPGLGLTDICGGDL